jgi:hypothetical protein
MNIPQLTIEMEEDGTVFLEQEWCGESDRIQLHPIHIRHLAELAGLLEPLKSRAALHPPIAAEQPTPEAETLALAESYFAAP